MTTAARLSEPAEIESLRAQYRQEMDCQIVHDSIHARPGWTREFALDMEGRLVGYGSLAIDGPWREAPTLYEFHVHRPHRMHAFELFEKLLAITGATRIETQSNDRALTVMLQTYGRNVRAEAILFEDLCQTQLLPPGAEFRATVDTDVECLRAADLDDGAPWVATVDGVIAGAGGVLYHYNPPYGDIYMKVAEPFQRRGLGAYLVQQLKGVCRAGGKIPAARCNVANLASRRTLQNAGFVPCGNIIIGELAV
jgi:GNAT superfamily N-acetyltransferase